MIKGTEASTIAYTKNGNQYNKTSKGKKIGTLAGIGAYAVSEGIALTKSFDKFIGPEIKTTLKQAGYNTDNMKTGFGFLKEFIKTTPKLGMMDEALYPGLSKMFKSKAGRVGYVAACAGLAIGTTALIGRGIGAICDKIKNNKAAKEADKAAQ